MHHEAQEKPNDLLVWMDLEMTGLNPNTDHILEVSLVLTDAELNVVAEGPERVIHFDEAFFAGLSEDMRAFLSTNNLIEASLKSAHTRESVEHEVREFLEAHITPLSSPLCGNTISKDREFLDKEMPKIVHYLHYRNIDVSTLKELAKRWRPDLFAEMERRKTNTHRAKEDIYESIEELKFYKENFLNLG